MTEDKLEKIKQAMKKLKKENASFNNPIKAASMDLPADFQLSEDFSRCFEALEKTRQNIYITGEAGTGKTTLLKYFRQNTKKNVVVLAPTGIAAINCYGQTIHSFFRFPGKLLDKDSIRRVSGAQKIFEKLDLLIIDEASMMRADLLDAVDEALRLNTDNPNDAFGGVQVVLFGDLYQLPPIIDRQAKEIYAQRYETPYFFSAKIFEASPFKHFILNKIYRQKDADFSGVLNKIRNKTLGPKDLLKLNARVRLSASGKPEDCMTLTPTNKAALRINETRLAKLKSPAFDYEASIHGEFEETLYPTEPQLRLKVGAQVLMIQNDPGKRWVNGSVGEITKLKDDSIEVRIDGKKHDVSKARWKKIKYKIDPDLDRITEEELGGFEQYPIKLAWAITIHKSQGLTFDRVIVDFDSGTFAHGQAYVALSRCRSLEGLTLRRPLSHSDIIFDPRVDQYHKLKNEDDIVLVDAAGEM